MNADELMGKIEKCKEVVVGGKNGQFALNNSLIMAKRAETLRSQLTPDEKDFIQYMSEKLPPVIGRAEVYKFLPGLVKPQTLAKADSEGLGPQVAWRVGRKIAYRTDSLLLWLVGRLGIKRIADMTKLMVKHF